MAKKTVGSSESHNNLLTFIEKSDNLSSEDARQIYRMIEKKEILSRYNLPIKPSSDGNYHIWVNDPTKKTGRRQIKAKTKEQLADKVYQYEQGIAGTTRKSFTECFRLLEDRKPALSRDDTEAESVRNSVRRETSTFRKYFEGTPLAAMLVDEIRKKDIENFAEMTLKCNDVRPKAYLAIRGLIRQTLDFAFKQEWIDENPHYRADYKQFSRLLIEPAEIEERVHTPKEIAQMQDYLAMRHQEKPDFLPAYALELQIMIGSREGEIPPLRWSDIQDGYVFIRREQIVVKKTADNNSSTVILDHTKTRKNRKYPVTHEVEIFLDELKKVQESFGIKSEYLFPSRDDYEKPIHNNSIYREYRKMCKALGITLSANARKGPHSYRRNAITETVNKSGGDIIMAAKLFGNSPNVIDHHYYTGLDLARAKKILEM